MPLEIKVGADPELFMKDKKGNYISAHGAVKGTKAKPHKVDKGAVQVDGMALEFNIDPATSEQEFVTNLTSVMSILQDMVPEYKLAAVPTAHFGAEYMATQPEEALEMGCEPDFNAWDGGKENQKPDGDADFRTGAGHIHIGWTEGADIHDPEHLEACMMVVKQLDWTLGIMSLLFDKDDKRRELYGDWGAFRPKPYGVEYRVLSNAWLKSEDLMAWVYKVTTQVIKDLEEGKRHYPLTKSPSNFKKTILLEVANCLDLPKPPTGAKKRAA